MKKFKPQGGLAALEVVIVAAIAAIFATVAVPNAARILGKVQLDYEMKRLYSTLNLARSLGKSSAYNPAIFNGKLVDGYSSRIEMTIRKDNDTVAKNSYEIQIVGKSEKYYQHDLRGGVKLSFSGGSPFTVNFDDANKYSSANSKTFTLTSKFGEAYIISDSVGRFRGTYEK